MTELAIALPKTGYQVALNDFEGPLDLLLHLVKESKLDITELSLAKVADQYKKYLQELQSLNVELESSYLVVFAHLLFIKSKVLLPQIEWEDDFVSPDPWEEEEFDLVAELQSFAAMKEMAHWLEEREGESLASYPRPNQGLEPREPLLSLNVRTLKRVMQRLERQKIYHKPPIAFKKMLQSVPDRVAQIKTWILGRKKTHFGSIFGGRAPRPVVVVTFLAVLEMVRHKEIWLRSESDDSDWWIVPRVSAKESR